MPPCEGKKIAAHLKQAGIETFLMDYTDMTASPSLCDDILERTGGTLDALFNNGAYGQTGAVEDLTTDVLRTQFETNVFGWHELTRLVVPVMRKQGHGRIVQCSSILGIVPIRYRGAYTASKFALEGLTITLRMELDGTGIHVSLIEPGPIDSRFVATALAKFLETIDYKNSVHAADYEKQLERLKARAAPRASWDRTRSLPFSKSLDRAQPQTALPRDGARKTGHAVEKAPARRPVLQAGGARRITTTTGRITWADSPPFWQWPSWPQRRSS